MGTQLLSPKREQTHQFRPIFIVAKRLDDQDDTWYGGRTMPRRHCVRSVSSPSPKSGGTPPQFSAYIYCAQTAGWMKMALGGSWSRLYCGTWGSSSPLQKGDSPQFSSHFIVPNRWMHQDTTWYGGRLQPRRLCYMGTQPPPQKGAEPRSFRRTSIVAATAQDLPFHKSFPP